MLLAPDSPWAWAGVGLFGWLWGSFLNQAIDRSPRRAGEPQPPGLARPVNLFRPARSICFQCGTSIAWYDNLPVFSYLLRRGACRHCGGAIGVRTLAVELLVPAACLGLYGLRMAEVGWAPAGRTALELAWGSWLLMLALLRLERRRNSAVFLLLGFAILMAWFSIPGPA